MKPKYELQKARIKEATLELIQEVGIEAISMNKIANKCRLNIEQMEMYFNSVKEILLNILNDIKENLNPILQQIAASNKTPEQRVNEFICTHYNYFKNHSLEKQFIITNIINRNKKYLQKEIDSLLSLQKKYLCKIIMDGIVRNIWRRDVSTEAAVELCFSHFYSNYFEEQFSDSKTNFDSICSQTYFMLDKILKQ
jgi:AcrR family transcriptional regulator